MIFEWVLNQQHDIPFVMVDSNNTEVTGLDDNFSIFLCKAGQTSFTEGTGTKSEIANGWYNYRNAVAEADTRGPVAIYVTGTGAVQQNLLARVETLQSNAIAFTYTVTTTGAIPVSGVLVEVSTDSSKNNLVWTGTTDALGVARDIQGNLPLLNAGTYYFWSFKSGYSFTNPDTETVSS